MAFTTQEETLIFEIIIYLHRQCAENQRSLEYSFSKFFQIVLQYFFPLHEGWINAGEQPPDGTLRRMDVLTANYDQSHSTISPVIVSEFKNRALKEVEDQGLDAALKIIDHSKLNSVYVLTTLKTRFRFWYVTKDERKLTPLAGSDEPGHRQSYLPVVVQIDGQWYYHTEMTEAVALIKTDRPLHSAPIVPSQSIDASCGSEAMDYQLDNPPRYPQVTQYSTETSANLPADTSTFLMETSSSGSHPNLEQDPDVSGRASSTLPVVAGSSETQQKGKSKIPLEVRVTKIPHLTRGDEYVFRDKRGEERKTHRRDWTEVNLWGRSGFLYRGNRTEYWCSNSKFPK